MMATMVRTRLSVPPPGAYGTTNSIVRLGYVPCARAASGLAVVASRPAPAVAMNWRLCMRSSWKMLDDSRILERALLGRAVPQLRQNVAVVLAEHRCGAVDRARRVGQLDGHAERLDGARPRVHEIHHHVARERVRIDERLRVRVDGAGGHAFLVEPGEPVVAILGHGRLLDLGDECRAVGEALAPAGEARVGGQV